MTPMPAKGKWRPTLGMIVFAVLAAVLALPVAGLNFFRLYENELVRQTESELIAQSVVLAAVFASEAERRLSAGLALGVEQPKVARPEPGARYQPLPPQLDLGRYEIRAPRPDTRLAAQWPEPGYFEIGALLMPLTVETQKRTLAGFRILDPQGTIIAGRGDAGLSLAHVEEVAAALKGRYSSALRQRISDEPPPPVYSISRGTRIRVFTALPIIVQGRVAGVIYASRTPSNIVKYLYGERRNVILAGLTVAAAALIVGLVFLRAITRPIHELIRRTEAMGAGERDAIRPLAHYGTREIAALAHSFFGMARGLFDRSDFVTTFAAHVSHELKSPLTSIQGAAELLRDSGSSMTAAERKKFLDNIIGDTQRLTALLQRLRELARADNPQTTGNTALNVTVADLRKAFPGLAIEMKGDTGLAIALSAENATIIFSHLADNAERHSATTLTIALERAEGEVQAVVSDNGDGISEQNRENIFDTFFTTRRDSGGTGMGLRIVRSMLAAHGGSIRLLPAPAGTSFELRIPAVDRV